MKLLVNDLQFFQGHVRFAFQFSKKQKPSSNTVKKIAQNFKSFGSVGARVQKNKPVTMKTLK